MGRKIKISNYWDLSPVKVMLHSVISLREPVQELQAQKLKITNESNHIEK